MNSNAGSRPDVTYEVKTEGFGVVAKPLSLAERLYGSAFVRKTVLLVLLAAVWEIYAQRLGNALVFPTFLDTVQAFVTEIVHGPLLLRAW